MAEHDLGTVQIFVDAHIVDIHFPYEHGELKDLLKARFKGLWVPKRKCWRVNAELLKIEAEAVVEAVREALFEAAPGPWRSVVDRFGAFACATKRFDVKFGAGGIRIALPGGHPGHYHLKKISSYKPQLETWLLPAKSTKAKAVMPIVKRAVEDDRRIVVEALEPYQGRTIKGHLTVPPSEADAMNIKKGRIVFADFAFLKVVDPYLVDAQLHYWPFLVVDREDKPVALEDDPDHVAVEIKLAYVDGDHACRAIRKLMAMPPGDRPLPLDQTCANSKWKSKHEG